MLPAISDSCEIVCVIVVSYKLSGIFTKISHNVVHLYENIHIHNHLGSYLPTFTILYESFQCTYNLMMCNVLLFFYADMDSANIFITCDSRTLGLLVPSGTKYVDLVEIISAEMKINISNAILKMEYDVGGNMAIHFSSIWSLKERIIGLQRAYLALRLITSLTFLLTNL